MNAPQGPAQGDGSHLPHGSVTAELVRLRADARGQAGRVSAPQGDGTHLPHGSVQAALTRATNALEEASRVILRQQGRIRDLEGALRDAVKDAPRCTAILERGMG